MLQHEPHNPLLPQQLNNGNAIGFAKRLVRIRFAKPSKIHCRSLSSSDFTWEAVAALVSGHLREVKKYVLGFKGLRLFIIVNQPRRGKSSITGHPLSLDLGSSAKPVICDGVPNTEE